MLLFRLIGVIVMLTLVAVVSHKLAFVLVCVLSLSDSATRASFYHPIHPVAFVTNECNLILAEA